MDYTNMTFGDLLVADIGDLPKHTRKARAAGLIDDLEQEQQTL